MYRTKKDVDRHVTDVLNKLQSSNEKSLRGYNFARLYYQVKDYESAKKHLSSYMSVRDCHAPSHKLMAQIHEVSGDLEKALQSYKRSLEVDSSQKDIVLKICELYCKLPVDHETARYWIDRADQLFPHNPVVFQLRECLLTAEGEPNRKELENLIVSELAAQPYNVNLRIKLLNQYLDTERVREAYEHAVKVESKYPFPTSLEWYYMLTDIFQAYRDEIGQELDANFYILYLTALNRLVYLNLCEPHIFVQEKGKADLVPSINNAATVLLQFDEQLKAASKKDLMHGSWSYFLDHMKGQLYLYLGSLLIKRAKKDQGNWKEACRIAAALFLVAYSFKPGNLLHEAWFCEMDDQQKVFTKFSRQASVRTSIIGHVILSLCKEDQVKWLKKIKQEVCVQQVQKRTYNRLFGNINIKTDESKSYFFNDRTFLEGSLEFPVLSSLLNHDKSCFIMCSGSLHHLVWLHMHWESTGEKTLQGNLHECFKGLQYSNNNLSKGSPESLCLLDIEAFLLATMFVTNLYLEKQAVLTNSHEDSQLFLPPDITSPLCTSEQALWWQSAYGLVNNTVKEKLGECRRTLQRGLEVIRGIGNHGLEIQLVVHLARAFSEKASAFPMDFAHTHRNGNINEKIPLDNASNLNHSTHHQKNRSTNEKTSSDKVSGLEFRARHYWNIALVMLDKLEANQSMRVPKDQMFHSHSKSLSKEEIKILREEGKLYIASHLIDYQKLEEAIEILETLSSPYASYYLMLAYKKLAMQDGTSLNAQTALLTKAMDALYLTMDRISGDTSHLLNEEIYVELEDLESRMEKLQTNANENISENESEADELHSANSSVNHASVTKTLVQKSFVHSTPKSMPGFMAAKMKREQGSSINRAHVEPSPERLDAQIRALSITQTTLVKSLVEQQRSFLETNNAIVEGLKQNKEVVEQLKEQLKEIQNYISRPQNRLRRRKSTLKSQDDDDEEEHGEYEENGILDYYVDDTVDSYRQGYYRYNQPRILSDGTGSSVGYVSQAALPTMPPPLAPYNYHYPPPPAHALAHQLAPPHHTLATAAPSTTQLAPHAPPGPLVGDRQYYPPHGLPFSEGQPLPQFRFHMPPSVVKPAALSNVSPVSQTSVAPLPTVPPAVASQLPQPVVQPSTPSWTKANTAPHAFQISLPSVTSPMVLKSPGPVSSLPVVQQPNVGGYTSTVSNMVVPPVSSIGHLQNMLDSLPASSTFGSPSQQSPPRAMSSGFFSFSNAPGVSPQEARLNRSRQDSEPCSEPDVEREVMGDFKPVIPLPAEVKLRTGEEDETVLCESRAKLFRFVDREWKERGVGVLKILKHEPSGKFRLLMRRDQVLKICANHYILPTMELSPLKGSDKAFTWVAQDFADETVKLEQFCIRFKTPEIAILFKKAFEAAVSFAKIIEKTGAISTSLSGNVIPPTTSITVGLPKPGSWTCTACYVNNESAKTVCVACESVKPGSKDPPLNNNSSNSGNAKSPFTVNAFSVPSALPQSNTASFGGKPIFQTSVFGSSESSSTANAKSPIIKPASITFGNITSGTSPSRTTEINFIEKSKEISMQKPSVSNEKLKPVSSAPIFSLPQTSAASKDQSSNITSTANDGVTMSKPVFGGFTFTSQPVVMEKADDMKDREILVVSTKSKDGPQVTKVDAKSSPFSAFSFKTSPQPNFGSKLLVQSDSNSGSSNVSSSTELQTVQGKGNSDFVFGSKSSVSDLQFSSLANSTSGFQTSTSKNQGFADAGCPVFVTVTKDGRRISSETVPEDFVPSVDFKPVVPLPALVNVKTGEENEEKVFGERAKLFRYDLDSKEWKECGIGELKILRSMKKYRIVMRREQVLKLCANHYILPEMKLSPMTTSEKAWVWFAQDYSQEVCKQEKFAARFKTIEIANQFHEVFERCRADVEGGMEQEAAVKKPHSVESNEDQAPVSIDVGIFKPQPGSWECSTCYVRNDQKLKLCQACDSSRPGSSPTEKKVGSPGDNVNFTTPPQQNTQSIFGNFQFKTEMPQSNTAGFVFGPKSTTTTCQFPSFSSLSLKPNLPTTTGSNTMMPVFGGTPLSLSTVKTNISIQPVTATPTFLFNTPSVNASSTMGSTGNKPISAFPFGDSQSQDDIQDPLQFRFGSPQKYEFNFTGVRAHSPVKCPKSPRSPETPTDAEDEYDDAESPDVDGIYFQPVIPLPPKVEVKTGEENETVMFSKRAKLYRFVDGEWKERGIGDIKVLHHPHQKTYRLLMRRDQVLKVCLNHYITKDLILSWKSDKSLSWAAADFSENEASPEQFAIRFKTPELAAEFKSGVDCAITSLGGNPAGLQQTPDSSSALSNFSFKLPEQSATSGVDSVRRCLDFTVDDVASTVEKTPETDAKSSYADKLASFSFSLSGQKMDPSSPFALTSKFGMTATSKSLFGNTSSSSPLSSSLTRSNSIEITYEAKPTPQQVAAAERLMLPPTFFLYENKPSCPGCRGCDEEDHKILTESRVKEQPIENSVPTVEEKKEDKENLEPHSLFGNTTLSTFSFADLASKNTSFDSLKSSSPTQSKQAFPGAGAPVFGNTSQSNEDEDGDGIVQAPDIHFEPVVPLPDIVDVKTGEEDEIVLFCSRAKLYKYDTATSQWKERALGNMKILQHKEHKSRCRLLMRREQVHKIACNHSIFLGLELKPLNTSETSFCWSATDYSEGRPENVQFAIRIKARETLLEFKQTIAACKAALSNETVKTPSKTPDKDSQPVISAISPVTPAAEFQGVASEVTCADVVQSLVEELSITEDAEGAKYDEVPEGQEYGEEVYEELDEEEEEDEGLVFDKRVSLEIFDENEKKFKQVGLGDLKVLYDDTVYGYRIVVINSQGDTYCDHIIAVQTSLRLEKRSGIWSAVDISVEPPRRRQFRATFSSPASLNEFFTIFEEGKKIAVNSEIVEKSDFPVPQLGHV